MRAPGFRAVKQRAVLRVLSTTCLQTCLPRLPASYERERERTSALLQTRGSGGRATVPEQDASWRTGRPRRLHSIRATPLHNRGPVVPPYPRPEAGGSELLWGRPGSGLPLHCGC